MPEHSLGMQTKMKVTTIVTHRSVMKCLACDDILSDREATRRGESTKEFLDLCDHCTNTIMFDMVEFSDSPWNAGDEAVRGTEEEILHTSFLPVIEVESETLGID